MDIVWLWWSTGKDSAWALHELRSLDGVQVTRLVTTQTSYFGRVAIHGTRTDVLAAQSSAVGLPVEVIDLPFPCSNADYEAAVSPLLRKAQELEVTHMAFGDLFLDDVRDYRESLLSGTGIEPIFPVWGEDTSKLARRMLDAGVKALITSLNPTVVDAGLAGSSYDEEFLDRIGDEVDPCGENGEFHTCVTAGPMLDVALRVETGEIVERDGFVYADVLLQDKAGGRTR